eukprot:9475-Pyramimonas_sp.AAC.1
MAWRVATPQSGGGASSGQGINKSTPNDRMPCRGTALEIMTPALQRKHDSKRAEARSAEMRPALQREHDEEDA